MPIINISLSSPCCSFPFITEEKSLSVINKKQPLMHYKSIRRLAASLMMALVAVVAMAQDITVSGVVKDNTGQPVPGAAVVVAGTTVGTVTDFDGNYTLSAPTNSTLQVSFIGYATVTEALNGRTSVNFTLHDDAQEIQEVVAVGYGTMKKSDLTGSISSVSTEKLASKGATSVMENLQGAVAGVSITQSTGRTNGGFDIEIRGKSSISSDTKPIYVIDGVVCSDMDFLNPQDIERLDVLKDASSTAIYGSRATAGVIMITTKGGAGVKKQQNSECAQKFNVTYDGYYGFSKVTREADFMSPEQFAQWRFVQYLSTLSNASNASHPMYYMSAANYTPAVLSDTEDGTSLLATKIANGDVVDWVDLVTQDGQKQNHYVAFSGSTSDISYHLGVGVTDERGVYKGDHMRRFNFKGSLDSNLNQYASVGFNINAAVTTNEYANDDAVQEGFRMNPFINPYDSEGNLIAMPGHKTALGTTTNQFTSSINPLLYMQIQEKEKITYRLLGAAYIEIKPIEGLSIKSTYAPNFTYYRDSQFDDKGTYVDVTTGTSKDLNADATAQYATSQNFGFTWTNTATYAKTFNQDHSLNLMFMNEWNHSKTEKLGLQYTNPQDGSLWYKLSSGTYDATNSDGTSYTENSMLSFAFRANYSFLGRYMLTGTVRWDGSSKFAEGNEWGVFPSVAAAWRISEESFMENTKDVLSNLKLRLSYGVTGNNAGAGNYATQQTVTGPYYQAFNNATSTGFAPSSIVNKDLSWEKSDEVNIGLDFGFLSNRISGTFDIYQKQSRDLLYSVQLPLESGGVKMTTNIGKVRNRGVEVGLTGTIIDNDFLTWEMSVNWAKNVNELKEIDGTGNDQPNNNLFIGETLNNIYGYVWDGLVTDLDIVVPDTEIARSKGFTPGSKVKSYDYYYACYGWTEGMPVIQDMNGDGKFDENDKKVYSSDPKWTGSLSTTLSAFGFDLSASLYTKQGYTVYSNLYERYADYSDRGRNRLNMDYYIPAGTLIGCDGVNSDGTYINPRYQQSTHYGKYPAVNRGATGNGSGSYFTKGVGDYVDASFVKIKNITLGYSLPKNVLEAIHLQKARIYCTVTNPFCWSKDDFMGWDPEWAGASLKEDGPATVTCEFGLNLKF